MLLVKLYCGSCGVRTRWHFSSTELHNHHLQLCIRKTLEYFQVSLLETLTLTKLKRDKVVGSTALPFEYNREEEVSHQSSGNTAQFTWEFENGVFCRVTVAFLSSNAMCFYFRYFRNFDRNSRT